MIGKKRAGMRRLASMGILLYGLAGLGGASGEDGAPLSAEGILQVVRGSYVGDNFEVDGQLRVASSRLFGSGSRKPFTLTGQPGYIQFAFKETGEVLQIDMTGERPVVREAREGTLAVVPPERYGEQVLGVPVLYEDLAMRYIHWPATKVLGEDTVQGEKCWHVEVVNPGEAGPYAKVHLWIGQKSGAVFQMEGFDGGGKLLKHFKVTSIHSIDGVWMFKSVGIESFDPDTGKRAGEKVYLETSNPRKSGSPMRKH